MDRTIGLFPPEAAAELRTVVDAMRSLTKTCDLLIERGGVVKEKDGTETYSYLRLSAWGEAAAVDAMEVLASRLVDLFQVRQAWKEGQRLKWQLAGLLYDAARERDLLTWIDGMRRSSVA